MVLPMRMRRVETSGRECSLYVVALLSLRDGWPFVLLTSRSASHQKVTRTSRPEEIPDALVLRQAFFCRLCTFQHFVYISAPPVCCAPRPRTSSVAGRKFPISCLELLFEGSFLTCQYHFPKALQGSSSGAISRVCTVLILRRVRGYQIKARSRRLDLVEL